jgi:hypothetical protein
MKCTLISVLALSCLSCVEGGLTEQEARAHAAPSTAGSSSGGAASAPAIRICDGSAGLRFVVATSPEYGGWPPSLPIQNGHDFLMVDGNCNYYVWDTGYGEGDGRHSPVRRGSLTPAEETELVRVSDYASWKDWDGQAFSGLGGPTHAGTTVFWNGAARFTCSWCENSSPVADATRRHTHALGGTLYARGEDLIGPMRFFVTEQFLGSANRTEIDWPFTDSLPLAALAAPDPGSVVWFPSHLITEASQLAELRSLRPVLASGQAGPLTLAKHPTPGFAYAFTFRDVLPFENDRGFIEALFPGAARDLQ